MSELNYHLRDAFNDYTEARVAIANGGIAKAIEYCERTDPREQRSHGSLYWSIESELVELRRSIEHAVRSATSLQEHYAQLAHATSVILGKLVIDGCAVVDNANRIPARRGFFVYLLFREESDAPFYIGQTTNLFGRLGSHATSKDKQFTSFTFVEVDSALAMDELEAQLIRRHKATLINRLFPVPPSERFGLDSEWEAA